MARGIRALPGSLALSIALSASCAPAPRAPLHPASGQPASSEAHAAPAAKAAAGEPRPSPWSPADIDDDPATFRFAIVTDRTGGHRDGVFEKGVEKTRLMRPELVMSVGDLIEGYSENPTEIVAEWEEFQRFVSGFGTRFYYVPGNHDISNPVMARAWSERFGPAYYHFVYKGVLFLCLNTEDGGEAQLGDAQLAYFERALAEHPNVRWTLLFMHRPLWAGYEGRPGRAAFEHLEKKLAGRPYTVFAGHFHNYEKYTRNSRRYFILATTGGASRLRGPLFGEFDHVAWVTMTKQGPRIANLLLDGILGEDVRTPESSAVVEAHERGFSVRLANQYLAGKRYRGGRTLFSVENATPSAVLLSARFGPSSGVEPLPHAVELSLAPGEKKSLPIEIRVSHPFPVNSVPPLPFDWTATFQSDPTRPIVLSDHSSFVVAPRFALRRRTRPVTPDGRLDEWGKLAIDVVKPGELIADASYTGPGDARYAFEVAHDEQNVYVAVDVLDDRVVADASHRPWEQDGIEISVDPRDDPARAENRRDYGAAWKTYAYLGFSPAPTRAAMSVWEPEKIPEGVVVACVPNARGYSAEVVLPRRVLDALRPSGHFGALRFNIAIRDSDEPGGPNAALFWQPDWHHETNVPGSGTFEP